MAEYVKIYNSFKLITAGNILYYRKCGAGRLLLNFKIHQGGQCMHLYTVIFQYIANKMQRYTVYLYLETALHVSGDISTHHQERIQLYLQHLVFVTPSLLPAAIAEIPDAVDTIVCAPDSGWRYHPKHVGQFPDINKLCKVASS
jgi:hypothetical protein